MLDHVSDIHICESALGESLLFPGPVRAPTEALGYLDTLLKQCDACRKNDFMITHEGEFFRGRREVRAVDGTWFALRRIPSVPPSLQTLPSPLPPPLMRLLLSPYLMGGGLVYVIGSPGAGKTTTASGAVISRLMEFGGFAYTVEDPPEMPLNGWHDKGYCRQTWVAGDQSADWAESFRGILRSQPVGTPIILFVGEVRDGESAEAMMRAAANGFLVIATGFGMDIPSGIEALVRMSSNREALLSSLSGTLRLAIHQRLHNGQIAATSLANKDGKSQIAAKIRAGQLAHLVSDIQFQANQMMMQNNLFN